MIEATCHCGAVRIEVDSAPVQVTSCNCSVCRRLGTLWAYYSPKQVRVAGTTATYSWGEKNLAFHRCAGCGCITHWSAVDPALDRMGVNARLMDPTVVAAARIKHYNGADA